MYLNTIFLVNKMQMRIMEKVTDWRWLLPTAAGACVYIASALAALIEWSKLAPALPAVFRVLLTKDAIPCLLFLLLAWVAADYFMRRIWDVVGMRNVGAKARSFYDLNRSRW